MLFRASRPNLQVPIAESKRKPKTLTKKELVDQLMETDLGKGMGMVSLLILR